MSQTELSRKVVKKRSSLLARAAHATSRSGKTRYNGGTEGAAATATGSSLGSQYGGGSGPRPARRALTASELALVREREEERAERERERIKRKRERRLDELERGLSSREKAASGSSKAAASSVAGAEAGGSGGVGGIGLPAASTSAATLAGILAGREAQRTSNTVIQDLPVPASTSATTAGGGGGSGVGGASPAASKRKQSAELRRIITHRKGFRALLDEAAASTSFDEAPINFKKAIVSSSRYPTSHRSLPPPCTICGYWADIKCIRCGERVCGKRCSETHDETRCERPI